jgi:fatty acid desaturase
VGEREPVLTQTDSQVLAPLFANGRVSRRDEWGFLWRLAVLLVLTTAGAVAALNANMAIAVLGIVLLGVMFTHAVELQHQCLHHSAFRRSKPHRWVGIVLGLPLLVNYSHYRVRHLQHHKYLGTEMDSEFFGFDPSARLTTRALLYGAFDTKRLFGVARDIGRSFAGSWKYGEGQISVRARRDVINEYRFMGLVAAALVAATLSGFGQPIARLWLLPLLVAMPLHFFVELPEHVFCESRSRDVLRNTRSITSNRFMTWLTNGNNLHVEHHAAMRVPLQRLPERHELVQVHGAFTDRSYSAFYRKLVRRVRQGVGA